MDNSIIQFSLSRNPCLCNPRYIQSCVVCWVSPLMGVRGYRAANAKAPAADHSFRRNVSSSSTRPNMPILALYVTLYWW